MHKLFGKKRVHLIIAAVFISLAILLLFKLKNDNNPELITTTVERGEVAEIVSVSGFVEAQNAAELAFPLTGIIDRVLVSKGDEVKQGDPLITLRRASLIADRQNALADLVRAQADRDQLLSGPRGEARSVTETEIAIATENLEQTRRVELDKVNNARRTLLSSGLTALSTNSGENAAAPTVTGTYQCDEEGSYNVEVFRSGAKSDYSYRISGLETGTYNAFTSQPGSFGTCGLFIQFGTGGGYANSYWTIDIPNKKASSYVTNLNAYELALEQAENAIRNAEQALELATKKASLTNADPRSEELVRANAAVSSAQARLAAVDAALLDREIKAPFDGVVTDIDVLPGETVTSAPIVTVLANDNFNMTVRIPEIDITKLAVEQPADIIFDALSNEVVPAKVHFISPIATEIDGGAYSEATMQFEEPPTWLRSGLNADVDILVRKTEDALRLPKRFVTIDEGRASVLLVKENGSKTLVEKEVEIVFTGNDGYLAIEGLPEGTIVAAP